VFSDVHICRIRRVGAPARQPANSVKGAPDAQPHSDPSGHSIPSRDRRQPVRTDNLDQSEMFPRITVFVGATTILARTDVSPDMYVSLR